LSTNAGSLYSNYYVGDFVCATDKSMMGLYQYNIFSSEDSKFLLNSAFVDLLGLATEEVTVSYDENTVTFVAMANNYKLYSKVSEGSGEFNIEAIKKMMAIEQDSYCKIRKKELLDLLDRLSLFVGAYDDGAILLNFSQSALNISSKNATGTETVNYTESKDAKDKNIKININRFMSQLKSYTSDVVELYYGSDLCIKLVDGDVTQVIALMR
jgi:DNA polymerase III sliding clamp (beta) subunit (PCNA family)